MADSSEPQSPTPDEPNTLVQIVDGRERVYCPTGCGSELVGQRCKLICPNCGPVISCSDL